MSSRHDPTRVSIQNALQGSFLQITLRPGASALFGHTWETNTAGRSDEQLEPVRVKENFSTEGDLPFSVLAKYRVE